MSNDHWQPIATAPRDRPVRLRGKVTLSDGDVITAHGEGVWLYADCWTGILGGNPDEWMEIEQ